MIAFTCALLYFSHSGHIIFTEQPVDVTVGCRPIDRAVFPCKYEGSISNPQWIINSTIYINSLQLPQDYMYENNELTVNDTFKKNGTEYQCYLLFHEGSSICARRSSVGRLIVKCTGIVILITILRAHAMSCSA